MFQLPQAALGASWRHSLFFGDLPSFFPENYHLNRRSSAMFSVGVLSAISACHEIGRISRAEKPLAGRLILPDWSANAWRPEVKTAPNACATVPSIRKACRRATVLGGSRVHRVVTIALGKLDISNDEIPLLVRALEHYAAYLEATKRGMSVTVPSRKS